MRRVWMILMLALLAACGAPQSRPTASGVTAALSAGLNVFAAASLTEAFGELGKTFEVANPGAAVTFNFAGSQQLAQQIGQGAPADVFASANQKQMDVVIQTGEVADGVARVFVRNRLVVIYPRDNPAGIRELKDLARPGLKIDLADKAVPVGQYALDFLDKAGQDAALGATFKTAVLANVVSYDENVRAVLGKVALGEVDVGIVYTSDVTPEAAANIGRIDIPDALNTVAEYPIAPLKGSRNAALAQRFVEYVLSPEGQGILAKYGFITTSQ
jgi:molybdate transport system substrate-binding protein